MIPEAATAANALLTGEIDWIEQPVPDLLPLLKRGGAITERLDELGFISQLRPNHIRGAHQQRWRAARDAWRRSASGT